MSLKAFRKVLGDSDSLVPEDPDEVNSIVSNANRTRQKTKGKAKKKQQQRNAESALKKEENVAEDEDIANEKQETINEASPEDEDVSRSTDKSSAQRANAFMLLTESGNVEDEEEEEKKEISDTEKADDFNNEKNENARETPSPKAKSKKSKKKAGKAALISAMSVKELDELLNKESEK